MWLWWSCRPLLQVILIISVGGGERETWASSSLSSWVPIFPPGLQLCPSSTPLQSPKSPNNLQQLQAQHQRKRQQPCINAPISRPDSIKIPTINHFFHIIMVICFSDTGTEDEGYRNKNLNHVVFALGPAVKEAWRASRRLASSEGSLKSLKTTSNRRLTD